MTCSEWYATSVVVVGEFSKTDTNNEKKQKKQHTRVFGLDRANDTALELANLIVTVLAGRAIDLLLAEVDDYASE